MNSDSSLQWNTQLLVVYRSALLSELKTDLSFINISETSKVSLYCSTCSTRRLLSRVLFTGSPHEWRVSNENVSLIFSPWSSHSDGASMLREMIAKGIIVTLQKSTDIDSSKMEVPFSLTMFVSWMNAALYLDESSAYRIFSSDYLLLASPLL